MISRRNVWIVLVACSVFCPLWSQTRIISHVTRADGGFTTSVTLENRSVFDSVYTIQPYNSAGVALTPVVGTLEPQATQTWPASDFFASGEDVSHFTVAGAVRAAVAYTIATGNGSPAHVGEGDDQGSRIRFFAGDWDVVFDGIAVVNTGSEQADIWVAQYGPDGEIVATQRIAQDLPSMGKALAVIGDPNGSNFDPSAGQLYEVYATQSLAVTALRGNIPGATFLWSNGTDTVSESTTTRDAQGVWFIEGGSLYSAIEQMGYNVAFDRMFQMETLRRSARGRLSELFGLNDAGTVNQDIFIRTTGYSEEEYLQGYQDLSEDARNMVKGYVDGINRRMAELRAEADQVPTEFTILQIPLDNWQVTDVLATVVALLRNFDPMDYGSGQLNNAALLQQLQSTIGEQAGDYFDDLRWVNDPDALTMIPITMELKQTQAERSPLLGRLRDDIDFTALSRRLDGIIEGRNRLMERLNARVKMGSYAWVVNGSRTATGNPIIYSGPQMGFMTPSIVVEGSIRGGGMTISGMSVPGIPGIIIGRSPHHAWSMQVGHAHTSDVYIEAPSSLGEPHRVETFAPLGQAPFDVEVFRTEHGPVISQAPVVAWKYAHWGKEFDVIEAFLGLARAESMDDFGELLEKVPVSQHFCYADRNGNIAYWMSGHNPNRPEGEWRFPQGAFPGLPILEYDIEDYRPLPHDRNTERGYYGGWNNKASFEYDNAPFGANHTYGIYHRARVVDDALADLTQRGNITFEELRDLAIDISATNAFLSLGSTWPIDLANVNSTGSGGGNPWPWVADAFVDAVANNATPERDAAIQIMNNWDGHFVDGGEIRWVNGQDRSDGWILMDTWLRRVMELTFEEVGNQGANPMFNALVRQLGGSSSVSPVNWFTNADGDAPQDAEGVIIAALDEALAALGERPWGLNLRGTIDYEHPIFGVVNQTPRASRSTYAHCVEFGPEGPVRIESFFPLGASGDFTNPNDLALALAPFFDNFQMRVFPLFP